MNSDCQSIFGSYINQLSQKGQAVLAAVPEQDASRRDQAEVVGGLLLW
jgi:hypothetical protein